MGLERIDRLDPCRDHRGMPKAPAAHGADGMLGRADVGHLAETASARPQGSPELPPDIRARLDTSEARAAAKVAHVQENPLAAKLFIAARGARSVRSRVIWLQRWGSAWAQPLPDVAACRRGCAHCCHLPVAITSVEAALIGEAVGRRPARLTGAPALKDLAADPGFAERERSAQRRGAEAGQVVLAEHDYRILRRWMDAPYGF